jgi:hypothetical protein
LSLATVNWILIGWLTFHVVVFSNFY